MNDAVKMIGLLAICAGFFACSADVQVNPELTQPEVDAELIGTLAPKSLDETDNDLTIGCETLDRDYADYHRYKEDLEQLGIRKIRLMAGWAKTEKVKGVYDFEWLDSIIDDAVSRGLEPWLETSYGNPIYEGGGTKYLAGGWPTSPEAIEAWDKWVEAMAVRYKGKVHEWEIWNEPDINKDFKKDVTSFVDLQIRTAEIIKGVDPDARIAGFAWAGWKRDLFDKCMTQVQERGKLDLFDWISYHFYRYRPEDMYPYVDSMRVSLDKYSTDIILRQGETGAPSKGWLGGALSKYDWSEVSQGKWALRRMISDQGRGIATTIFCISDMNYFKDNDHIAKKNVKGLLETDDDNNVLRRKQSYYAVQNLVSVWDCFGVVVSHDNISVESDESHSVYAFRNPDNGLDSFVIWNDKGTPTDDVVMVDTKVSVRDASFRKPVCVDIRTGNVYSLEYAKYGSDWTFEVPVYDSPVYVVDKSMLKLK